MIFDDFSNMERAEADVGALAAGCRGEGCEVAKRGFRGRSGRSGRDFPYRTVARARVYSR